MNNLKDVKLFFKRNVDSSIIGVGVEAFNRLGPEKFIENFKIVCAKDSQDLELIEKNVETLCLEKEDSIDKYNSYNIIKKKRTKEFISKNEDPHLIFYKVTDNVKKVCDENKWNIIGSPISDFDIFRKSKLREVVDSLSLPKIPGRVEKPYDMDYKELKESYGNFVVQVPDKSGGRGTFFINSESDFSECIKATKDQKEVVVTKFIKGVSPSIMGCVTKHGILYSEPRHQLIDVKECLPPNTGGVYCGHDWSFLSNVNEQVKERIYECVLEIGKYLKNKGYKGIFGLDLLYDGKNVFIVEVNPRLVDGISIYNMLQVKNKEPPLLAFHILEFLDLDYDINIDEINKIIKGNKSASHVILKNRSMEKIKNKKCPKPGIYSNDFIFKRPSYSFTDLEDQEILITGGMSKKPKLFESGQRISRLILNGSILKKQNNSSEIKTKYSKLIEKIYENLFQKKKQ